MPRTSMSSTLVIPRPFGHGRVDQTLRPGPDLDMPGKKLSELLQAAVPKFQLSCVYLHFVQPATRLHTAASGMQRMFEECD